MKAHTIHESMTGSNQVSATLWDEHAGKPVYLFTLKGGNGTRVTLTNYGATIVSVHVPDKNGELENVVLGFDSLNGYVADRCYIGCTVGRFANRIGGATFELDGTRYTLDKNDNGNCNHGGNTGFHARVFDADVQDNTVVFSLESEDGQGGFPGKIKLTVTYAWTDDQALTIRYRATTDRKTVLNLTNHAYFNLSASRGDISRHILTIPADDVLETNQHYIPTGNIVPAGDFIFRHHTLHDRIKFVGDLRTGVNHYYILDQKHAGSLQAAATLTEPMSGRVLQVFTTYPGVQCYTGDYLNSTAAANHPARLLQPFDGLCLECQHYPDAPNHAHFPATMLAPGKIYDQTIVYKFGVVRD